MSVPVRLRSEVLKINNMKKVFTFIFVLTTLFSFSQQILEVYKIKSGPYNKYTETFNLESRESNMRIFLDNSTVRMTDEARSVYIVNNSILRENNGSAYIMQWDAIDEKARKCSMFMTYNRNINEKIITILYSDFVFHYYHY